MNRVKLFQNSDLNALQDEINDFLESDEILYTADIQGIEAKETYSRIYIATVWYILN